MYISLIIKQQSIQATYPSIYHDSIGVLKVKIISVDFDESLIKCVRFRNNNDNWYTSEIVDNVVTVPHDVIVPGGFDIAIAGYGYADEDGGLERFLPTNSVHIDVAENGYGDVDAPVMNETEPKTYVEEINKKVISAETAAKNAETAAKKAETAAQQLETQKVDLTEYVKNTDYATGEKGGVVKVGTDSGKGIRINANGEIYVRQAWNSLIDLKSDWYHPITPSVLDYAVQSCTNQDLDAELTEEQLKLPPSTQAFKDAIGDIDTALDSILAIQNSYI